MRAKEREAHNYRSVRCEDEEDLKFSYTTRTHTHAPCGYQELPLTGLCFIISYRASGKDTLPLLVHPPSFPAAPHLFLSCCSVLTQSFFTKYLSFFPLATFGLSPCTSVLALNGTFITTFLY